MPDGAGWLAPQVISVHRHVEGAHRYPDTFNLIHRLCQAMGKRHTSGGNAHETPGHAHPGSLPRSGEPSGRKPWQSDRPP